MWTNELSIPEYEFLWAQKAYFYTLLFFFFVCISVCAIFWRIISGYYTWYSENKTTKQVIDYVLVDSYVQQHVKNCSVKYNLDLFGSDHPFLMVKLCTPSTKKARKSLKKHSPTQKPDPNSLATQEGKQLILQKVRSEILHRKQSGVMIGEESIVSILKDEAETTLPKLKRTNQSS